MADVIDELRAIAAGQNAPADSFTTVSPDQPPIPGSDLPTQLRAVAGGQLPVVPPGPPPSQMPPDFWGRLAGQGTEPLIPSPSASAGSILPISKNAQGTPQFDPYAGILGSVLRSVTLGGDIERGRMGPDMQMTPELASRSLEAAQLMSPVSPAMRAGSYPIPGERMAQTQRQPITPPTAQELKAAGGAGYQAANASGVDISGQAVADMANNLQMRLQGDHGIIAKNAPKSFAIIEELARPPEGGFATIAGLRAARKGLSSLSIEGGQDGFAAGNAVRAIDELFGSLGPQNTVGGTSAAAAAIGPTLREANANYAAANRSNDLTGTLTRGVTGISERATARAQATNSGQNIDNAIRQRVLSLLEKPKDIAGYSNEEIAALRQLVEGGTIQNAARTGSNILGGGRGLGAAVAGGIGAGIGAATGGPVGAAVGAAAPPLTGAFLKMLENAISHRGISAVDELVRQRSPLYQQQMGQSPLFVPGLDRDAAVLRALMPPGGAAYQPQMPTVTPRRDQPPMPDLLRRPFA